MSARQLNRARVDRMHCDTCRRRIRAGLKGSYSVDCTACGFPEGYVYDWAHEKDKEDEA